MLKRTVCYLLLIFAFSVTTAFAQEAETPTANPAESAAILEALSVPVSKDLRQKITFSTENLKERGGRRAKLEAHQVSRIHRQQ
jgi:hypothetical protein